MIDYLLHLTTGQRIEFFREQLRSSCGDVYSNKRVANRIGMFSPSTLLGWEQNKVKDIPATKLFAISKDLGIDIYAFFDDFYKDCTLIRLEVKGGYYDK